MFIAKPNPRLLNIVNNAWGNDKKLFWSWCSKKGHNSTAPTTTSACKPESVFRDSTCRRRMPQCPEHIDSGDPSRCCENDYGKPIKVKKTWWTNEMPSPPLIKQKPSNCDPPPCPKEVTFMEYLFGPEKPLPEPRSCRRAWQIQQNINYEDPRLDDPRYQMTEGDVLLFTEPDERKTRPPPEPQPKAPWPSHKAPAGVICKRFRDTVAATALECYCACADPCLFYEPPSQTHLCPVHSKPFRFPYDEMKPQNRRNKFFSDKHGVAAEDVMPPPRRESCSCEHSAFVRKSKSLLPEHETCDMHEALQRKRHQVSKANEIVGINEKMSKCEKLRLIVTAKEKQISETKIPRKAPSSCDPRCKECVPG